MATIMDPAASVDRLSVSITQLSVRVDKFAAEVHDAKQDMQELSDQLASLEECLETLESDFGNPAVHYPDRQKKNLRKMVDDCDRITKEMLILLTSLSSDHGDGSWSGFSKAKMGKLQDALEADRSGIALVIGMKQLSDAEQNRLNRAANSNQDTESMLSIRQSLLETAPVPYAKEDPYPESSRPQAKVVAIPESVNNVRLSRFSIDVIDQENTRRDTGINNTPTLERSPQTITNDHRTSTQSWFDNQFAGLSISPARKSSMIQPEDNYQIPDDWTNRQLIVAPIEQTGEGKEVVPSNFSIRSAKTMASVSEASARTSAFLPLEEGKIDQIAITAAAKARNRLNDSDQKKLDKDLLKRVKEGAEVSKIVALLDRGADPNASGPRNTVLTTEIQYSCRQQVIELLLSRGSEPNATSDGIPPYKIIQDGNMSRLRSKLGKSIDAVPFQVGILFLAALNSTIETVKILIAYGARVRPYPESGLQRTASPGGRPSLDRRNSFSPQPGAHRSAILAAAENEKWDIVEFLVLQGADPNDTASKIGSTLQLATAANKKELMQLLIDRGADVDAQEGQFGASLIAAAYEGHPTAAKILLESGAKINIQSRKYGTALNTAVLNGYLNVVRLLLERGADHKVGYVLDTALQTLKDDPENSNRKAIVRLLEAKGARSGPADKKIPEWAGLFSESY